MCLCARPYTVARLAAYRNDVGRKRRPSARNAPHPPAPPAPDTSSPLARRSCPRALAAESLPAATPPAPAAATPNSRCGRSDAPTHRVHSRSVAPSPPATSLVPARFPAGRCAAISTAAKLRHRSLARPWPRPCPGRVVRARPRACGRRSPGNGRGCLGKQPPRWASAGRCQPATPAIGAAGAARGLANAPIAGPVGETPVASSPARDSVCLKPGLVFCGGGGSVPGSLVGSIGYGPNWSFAVRRISAPITPMKSARCAPNWSFANSHGSWSSGAGNRSGSGGWGACVARRSILQAMA